MTDFVDFAMLLAAIDQRALEAILGTIEQMPGVLPALQAWIEHAARWEYDRRSGFHYALQGPMASISPDELPAALGALALISECFRHERRREVAPVVAFFEGLARELAGERARAGVALH